MNVLVVDTNVVSVVFKRRHPLADAYEEMLIGQQLVISFMTFAELMLWPLMHNWGAARRAALDEHLEAYAVYFADEELCLVWADVISDCNRKGRPITPSDAWIAAAALYLNAPLVTQDLGHFRYVDRLEIQTA